jgi:hypothetical protein
LGSVWGETSIWYLAGKGKQPHDLGYWWEETLRRVKMLDANDVPNAFPPTYRNQYFEFNSWLLNSRNPEDWSQRWQEFKEYVESVLWGTREPSLGPRPVVLGWHHTRLITGSDGTNVYINNPGGAQYSVFPWERLRQQVITTIAGESDEKVQNEAYGTFIFLAPARPEEERRGALWLLEHNENDVQGALVLRRGADIIATWHWGGDAEHDEGYYYRGKDLPSHQRYGKSFPVRKGDRLEYQFYIQNIGFQPYKYTVQVDLYSGTRPISLEHVAGPNVHAEVELNGRPYGPDESETNTQQGPYVSSFDAGSLEEGEYTLKFMLYQGSTVQDVKYLSFAVSRAKIREYFDLTVSYWHVLHSLVDDSPGALIDIKTGEVKPVPPRFLDVLKYMLIHEVAKTIHGETGLEARREALKSMIRTLQEELDGLTENHERQRKK